jgi:S1-C subfamily serine protease
MQRILVIAVAAALALALPAWAGGTECNAAQTASQVETAGRVVTASKAAMAEKCTESTQTCLDYMVNSAKDRGWVGIEMDTDEASGALSIRYVEPDSPAKRAGLQPGDVLAAMNGIRFSDENKEAMQAAHQNVMKIGATITYTVLRDGREQDVPVTLGEIPQAVLAKWVGRHMLEHASVALAQK